MSSESQATINMNELIKEVQEISSGVDSYEKTVESQQSSLVDHVCALTEKTQVLEHFIVQQYQTMDKLYQTIQNIDNTLQSTQKQVDMIRTLQEESVVETTKMVQKYEHTIQHLTQYIQFLTKRVQQLENTSTSLVDLNYQMINTPSSVVDDFIKIMNS